MSPDIQELKARVAASPATILALIEVWEAALADLAASPYAPEEK